MRDARPNTGSSRSHTRLAWLFVSVLVVAVVVVSLGAGAAQSFVDIAGNPHEADIEYIASRGVTSGCNPPKNDRYCPERALTRAEMATFLVRSLALPASNQDFFGDDNGSAFEGHINTLAASGITKGCNPPKNDRYCPHGKVTRGQMAAFLARALNLQPGLDFFVDDDGHPFEPAINAIAQVGIVRGCNPPANTRYCPDQLVTRAQMATYLRRAMELGAGATTTTTTPSNLKDAIPIAPGVSIQAVVDRHPPGTVFLIRSGIHVRQTVAPRNGDRFIGEPGSVLDGQGVSEYAFGSSGNGVLIEGLVIRNYVGGFGQGAIRSVGGALDWTIRGNEIHHNRGAGIRANPGWKIIRNHIHHNSQIGIIGGFGRGVEVRDNEIAYNNPERAESPYVAAGGMKLLHTIGAKVIGNFSHHNGGPGLWTDGDNIDVLYEGNRVEDNAHAGIKHEVSCRATIRNNTALRNGFENNDWIAGAGILIINSPDVTVTGNVVRNNNDGIGGVQASRKSSGKNCTWQLKNLTVSGNVIEMRVGHTGVVTDDTSDVFTSGWANRFSSNTYSLHPTSGKFFRWLNKHLTYSEWRKYHD
jgi:hypothetical protein